MSVPGTPSMIELTPQHHIKGSTIFWIGFSAIATLLGFGMYIFPKLFEKKSVSGTCPDSYKCCNTCGLSGKRLLIGTAILGVVIGGGLGYFLHSSSKSNGGGGLSPALFQSMSMPSMQ